ncbi:hypothetical protein E2C01_008663 [Portunus trituberculatus]|uniref:Uncharacterized protein n=1 Tax=Portunus trituberculatus TaxID=210409 RepID=A0A5B7D2J8_PORTR|nr:hypothetical protein [Portunus trituberculatus]
MSKGQTEDTQWGQLSVTEEEMIVVWKVASS